MADGATSQQLLLKTLVVQGATVVTQPANHLLTLQASDIVTDPLTGLIDRTATAENQWGQTRLIYD